MPAEVHPDARAPMTVTTTVSTLGVLLALLLVSMAWSRSKPGWQIVFGPPHEPANRIALTEFYARALALGWDFSTDRQLFQDLAAGLREAGLAGCIEMWGRKCRAAVALPAPREPLLGIPAGYWKHHEIDALPMAVAGDGREPGAGPWRIGTSNLLVRTCALPTSDPDCDDAIYGDIQLNYLQAMNWLQTDASHYKGIAPRSGAEPGRGG